MRITYLHQYFNTPAMSGGTRSYELARRLVAKGHEVNMITSWRDSGKTGGWFETTEAGIKVHWLPVPYSNRMGYRDRVGAFLRFAWAAARRAAQLSSDVVYATSTPLTIVLPATYAASQQRVPMIFEVRDLWPDVPVAMGIIRNRLIISAARSLEKFAYRRAVTTVVLTPSMRDFVSGKGVPLHRISVISNGSDPARFGRSNGRADSDAILSIEGLQRKRVLLYCGSLGPAHGPDYLVGLAEELRRQSLNVCLRVVGD
ncbi:MAG: glycosyltransferase family 4 protein, partial [Haliea sp.]